MPDLWDDLGAGTVTLLKAYVAYFTSLLTFFAMSALLHQSTFGSGLVLNGFLFLKLSIMELMAFGVALITLLYAIRVFVMMFHFHRIYQQQAEDPDDPPQAVVWILINIILAIALLALIFALWVADSLDFKLDESSKESFRKVVAFSGSLAQAVFLVIFLTMAIKLLGMAFDGLRTQLLKMLKPKDQCSQPEPAQPV